MSTACTARYAVMGHPVGHSRSPFIHAAFALQTGQDLEYTAIEVAPGGFAAAAERFWAGQGRGLNITLPFKEEAFALSTLRTRRAARAGAVNTLWRDDAGAVHGDNTDGAGLVRDLTNNLALTLEGAGVLLLGAGGAARGVVGPLLDAGAGRLVIANRTPARADALATDFAGVAPVHACAFAALGSDGFDIIINATSASLGGELPPLPKGVLRPGGACYDMMYASEPTVFVRWGRANSAGCAAHGIGMLVEQAAESFFVWRGVRPHTAPVIAELELQL